MSHHFITQNCKGAPVPSRPDGGVFEWAMRFADDTRIAWADDLESLVGVLLGVSDYVDLAATDPQAALVARIRGAIRIQCWIQALVIDQGRRSGSWDRCTPEEQAVLLSPRHEQPIGWNRDLFGEDWDSWLAPVALVVISTGYGYDGRVMPRGEPERLWWIDPIDDESLLFSLDEIGYIGLFQHGGL